MSARPVLLFLHGIGDGEPENDWMRHLEAALVAAGHPDLSEVEVIAPKYAHALKGADERLPVPPLTIKDPPRADAKLNRRSFEHRTAAMERRLGRHNIGDGMVGAELTSHAALALPKFMQARNYLQNQHVRANVLTHVLSKVPQQGSITIIGYSLGSVIAADLVRRLPSGLTVTGLVTIGSPLAGGDFNVDDLRTKLGQPPTNLGWWVNVWNHSDAVAANRGLSSVVPWVIDFRIHSGVPFPKSHDAEQYLSSSTVAEAVGFSLFGSKSRDVQRRATGVDAPLDFAEQIGTLALRYATLVAAHLEGDQQDRYRGALRSVQATAVDEMIQRRASEGRPLPSVLVELAFDASDPESTAPNPPATAHMDLERAITFLSLLAAENPIRPFEITVKRDKLERAMMDLSSEMGLTSKLGSRVFEAAKIAHDVLAGANATMAIVKWGAVGVGLTAIVVATGGLALAAGAGLAGAAAITSALAAFGPGGMIGGLVTAGALVSAGGGGIAFGLASPATSAAALEAFVERRLAIEVLRMLEGLDPEPTTWRVFADTEIELRREFERLDEYSDDSAPSIKELKQKLVVIERALRYLREKGRGPK